MTDNDDVSLLMAYEAGELNDEGVLTLFARLIRTGLAWKLQGHYERTAKAFIEAGYISPKGVPDFSALVPWEDK